MLAAVAADVRAGLASDFVLCLRCWLVRDLES